ncbi:MAG TPA: hypothetical protein DEQ32_10015 [Gammaproteobacteria bacterium]|jgi:hypothetical protein|nr:hypothetical protein [Gammaproteobacteria bacterium]|tara:strand:+ start:403 stop:618 length:216 start_codon:yes stop_codon:yes gene_type:complete
MVEKKRARGKGGKFKADDPSTPENEAWEEVKPKAKAKPKAKPKPKAKASSALPPVGSAARKSMILRGEIEE